MKFIEVVVSTTSEAVEIVTAVLMELGVNGLIIEDDADLKSFLISEQNWDYIDEELLKTENTGAKIKFYVPDDINGKEIIISVKNALGALKREELEVPAGSLSVDLVNVNDEDWLNNWKKYYKPFEIGEKIIIKPEWEEYENNNGKIIFNINPGLAFGTGMHQTTQMCVIQLEKYIKQEMSVIDIGCGSGILSVISLLLGAERVFAADIDSNAVRAAAENLKLNAVPADKCEIVLGNIMTDDKTKQSAGNGYDIAVANIVADAVIGICDIVSGILKQDGIFIASGIIKERLGDVYAAIEKNSLKLIETLEKDDWVCVVCQNSL